MLFFLVWRGGLSNRLPIGSYPHLSSGASMMLASMFFRDSLRGRRAIALSISVCLGQKKAPRGDVCENDDDLFLVCCLFYMLSYLYNYMCIYIYIYIGMVVAVKSTVECMYTYIYISYFLYVSFVAKLSSCPTIGVQMLIHILIHPDTCETHFHQTHAVSRCLSMVLW